MSYLKIIVRNRVSTLTESCHLEIIHQPKSLQEIVSTNFRKRTHSGHHFFLLGTLLSCEVAPLGTRFTVKLVACGGYLVLLEVASIFLEVPGSTGGATLVPEEEDERAEAREGRRAAICM